MLAGEPAPTGPNRRGAKPPDFPVSVIDAPALPQVLAELAARADEMDADTPPAVLRAQGDRLVAAPGLDHLRSDDRHRAAPGSA
ncbi:hypothetical protein [Streptomyces justiciae]|uniref:Uncharacterized protein n=1 Tax=Streptomyces justiciae TaxID=2780140 RepID=A0ABU3LNF8_9ACTN|nr:hypothetical protein [Streptomyces justiciae]MDT7840168.1 hypothetical protein [Streptomyces justiciae]